METYCVELTEELKRLVDMDIRKLPGRKDGRPPSLIALILFYFSSGVFLFQNRNQYDAVHFGDFVLFPLAWWHSLVAARSSRFISVHGLDLLYGNRKGLKPTIYRCFIAWARRRRCVHHFIANSQFTARICRNTGFAPVTAVPLGIRLTGIADPALPAERYVLFIGRLIRRKGAAWFAKYVLPQLPSDVRFYVVGKIWDRDEWNALQSNPRVTLFGYVSDKMLAELRCGARAIVMPNLMNPDHTDVEGFGIVALEAAASGAPLAASNIEGLTDAVRDGETGFLVESGDVKDWVNKISELIEWSQDMRDKFTYRALDTLRNYYSWRRVAEDTIKIYMTSGGIKPQ